MYNRKGFTLVELILVLAVTTILLGVVISIFLQSINMFKIDETKSANQDSLNIAVTSIEKRIRSASTVVASGSGCVINSTSGSYAYSLDTSTNTLSVNNQYLTSRIASFTCLPADDAVTLSITTIEDRNGIPQSLYTKIIIRKGE